MWMRFGKWKNLKDKDTIMMKTIMIDVVITLMMVMMSRIRARVNRLFDLFFRLYAKYGILRYIDCCLYYANIVEISI